MRDIRDGVDITKVIEVVKNHKDTVYAPVNDDSYYVTVPLLNSPGRQYALLIDGFYIIGLLITLPGPEKMDPCQT